MHTPCVHPSDDALEMYAMRRLSDDEGAPLEEHILICLTCQDRLAEVDEYLHAIRVAAQHVVDQADRRSIEQSLQRVPSFRWPRALALAGVLSAFTVALAVTLTDRRAGRMSEPAIVEVGLASARGLDSDLVAHARASNRIALKIDLTELPKSPRYEVEVASADGKLVSKSRIKPSGDQLVAPVDGLAPGTYWVRLYGGANSSNLLREYELLVE